MELFTKRATEISTALSSYYYTFVDVLRFNEKVIDELVKAAGTFYNIDIIHCQDLAVLYMNLLTTFIKLQVLLSRGNEASRAYIPAYAKAHHIVSGNSETNFSAIADYLTVNQAPFDHLRQHPRFQSLGSFVSRMLNQIEPIVVRFSDRSTYFAKQIFDVTDRTDDLFQPKCAADHGHILHLSEYYEWILWTLHVFPSELVNENLVNLMATALRTTFTTPIHRDIMWNVWEDTEELFENFQIKTSKFKLSKHKKVIKDMHNEHEQILQNHSDWRRYLCAELESVTSLLKLAPQFIGPKFSLVLALLTVAREEVLWHFFHVGTKPHRAPSRFAITHDTAVVELVHRVTELCDLLLMQPRATTPKDGADASKDPTESLSMAFLARKYHERALQGIAKTLGARQAALEMLVPNAPDVFAALLKDLTICDTLESLEPLRVNALRLQAVLTSGRPGDASALSEPLHRILFHSRALDKYTDTIREKSSFKLLCFVAPALQAAIAHCLPPSTQSVYAFALLRTLGQAVDNVHRVCPEEVGPIGHSSAVQIDVGLNKLTSTIVDWLKNVFNWYRDNISSKVQPPTACAYLRALAQAQSRGRDSIAAVVVVNAQYPLPGSESYLNLTTSAPPTAQAAEQQQELAHMQVVISAMTQLSAVIASCKSLEVYTFEFSPREYLRIALQSFLRSTVRAIVATAPPMTPQHQQLAQQMQIRLINRPSAILATIRQLTEICALLDRRHPLGFSDMLRTVLHTELAVVYPKAGADDVGSAQCLRLGIGATDNTAVASPLSGLSTAGASVGVSGTTSTSGGDGSAATSSDRVTLRDPAALYIMKWYVWIFAQELDSLGIVYNKERQCFESLPYFIGKNQQITHPIHAELYTDRTELRALATLFGPRGVAKFQEKLLAEVSKMTKRVFELTQLNAPLIAQVKGRFTEGQLWLNTAAQLQQPEQFIYASVIIGGCLRFRDMLQQALSDVVSATAPTLKKTIAQSLSLYKDITKTHPGTYASAPSLVSRSSLLNLEKTPRASMSATGRLSFANPPSTPSSTPASPTSSLVNARAAAAHSMGMGPSPYLALEYLAETAGEPFEVCDPALRDAVRKFKTSTQDAQVWQLLPEMYALSMYSAPWMNAKFDITSQAHDNNMHLLTYAVRELIIVFTLLPSLQQVRSTSMPQVVMTPEECHKTVRAELERFVECTAHSMLNIANAKQLRGEHQSAADSSVPRTTALLNANISNLSAGGAVPPQMLVFLEQFMEACSRYLHMSKLEECLPYTLLRTNYIQMYESIPGYDQPIEQD